MKHTTLALITALALANTAFAFSFKPYVSIGGGLDVPAGDSEYTKNTTGFEPFAPLPSLMGDYQLQNINWNGKYKMGYAANVAIGTELAPNMRVDLEFLYQNIRRQMSGSYDFVETRPRTADVLLPSYANPIENGSTRTNIYSLFINGYFDFKNGTPMTPFIGAGIGAAWINSGSANGSTSLLVVNSTTAQRSHVQVESYGPSLSSTTFAWQLKGGLDMQFSPHFDVVGQWRLFGTTRIQSQGGSFFFNTPTGETGRFATDNKSLRGFLNNIFDLNLVYKF